MLPEFLEPRSYANVIGRTPTRRRHALLPLEWKDGAWSAIPTTLFRPRGLIVVGQGASRGFIAEWTVGTTLVMPYGTSNAKVSLDAMTFMESLPHDAPCRPSFPSMDPSMTTRLVVVDLDGNRLGPPLELSVWGEAAIFP